MRLDGASLFCSLTYMFFDEDLPKKARNLLNPPVLDALSVAELEGYKADLKAEEVRVDAEIARKQAHMKAAGDIFKS